jgi:AcrR family transcriptional regulator
MQVLKDEVKAEIDRAAAEVFMEMGYRRASMKEIALRAGTSVSNIYHYYPNKMKLFSTMVQPVLYSIHRLLDSLMEEEEGRSFVEADFRGEFEQTLVRLISEFLDIGHQGLLLLFDKSEGTPYAASREEIIQFMEKHFSDSLPRSRQFRENRLLMHIFASNLMEGLLEILRHTQKGGARDAVLRGLIQYHINGIYPFFEEG